jgi:hypothetical protein
VILMKRRGGRIAFVGKIGMGFELDFEAQKR